MKTPPAQALFAVAVAVAGNGTQVRAFRNLLDQLEGEPICNRWTYTWEECSQQSVRAADCYEPKEFGCAFKSRKIVDAGLGIVHFEEVFEWETCKDRAAKYPLCPHNYDIGCGNKWHWEECSGMYWRNICYDTEVDFGGWVYQTPGQNTPVTFDEYASWEMCSYNHNRCGHEFFWEECSGMYVRWPCADEPHLAGDTIYTEATMETQWRVSADEYATWESCSYNHNRCGYPFFWEECSGLYFRWPCADERHEANDYVYTEATKETQWLVTAAEFASWESCNYNFNSCGNTFYWTPCSGMFFREPCANEFHEAGDYIYTEATRETQWRVTAAEYATWESCNEINRCGYPFYWEECSGLYFRHPCGDEPHGAGDYIYTNASMETQWLIPAWERANWESCNYSLNLCGEIWIYEECSGWLYRSPCPKEYHFDYDFIYTTVNQTDYWRVTWAEFLTWEACW